MLAYEDIAAGLHYHAHRFESRWFEHWELVNEAWIAVHGMKEIKLARMAIPWRMLDYMRANGNLRRVWRKGRVNDSVRLRCVSLHYEICTDLMLKDVLASPKRYNNVVDNQDTIDWLTDNCMLNVDERIMLDMRFYRSMLHTEIGRDLHMTPSRVCQRMKIIMLKLQAAAKRLRR